MRHFLCFAFSVVLLASSASFAHADFGNFEPVEPPATGLLDKSKVFENSMRDQLVAQIQELKTKYHFHLYVVTLPLLLNVDTDPGINLQNYAAVLRSEWLPKENGLVVAIETDRNLVQVGRNMNHEDENQPKGTVPNFITENILAKAIWQAKQGTSRDEVYEKLVTSLLQEYRAYFQAKHAQATSADRWATVFSISAISIIICLGGLGLWWLARKTERTTDGKTFFIPDVEAGERLGAPYGGGNIGLVRFGEF